MSKILNALLATICASLMASLAPAAHAAQSIADLDPPEGPYAVGYEALDYDTGTPDALSGNATRRLKLEIWYPADRDGIDPSMRRPLFSPAMQEALSRQFPFPSNFAETARANAISGLRPIAGPVPVVLLSHGLSFPIALYQSFAERLASEGYAVVAVNHPHAAGFIEYADGSTLDMSAWPAIDDERERQRFLATHADVWEQDLVRVLDWLEGGASGSAIAEMTLAPAIGGLGHSYGGTAIGRLAGKGLIDAAVVMEGAVRDADSPDGRGELEVRSPLLHLIGGYNRLEHEGSQYRPTEGAPVYQAVINGTGHAELSDLILHYGQVADAGWRARHRYDLQPDRVLLIAADYAVAFFDRYLRGSEASVLLTPKSYADKVDSPRTGGFPEVELSIAVR